MSPRDVDAEALYRAPRLYDLLCPALTEGDAELAYWRGVCDGASDVLELGCGTGRVAVPLARGGLRVTGLDRAPAMLDRARALARAAGADARWVEGDMTRLAPGPDSALPAADRFDVVLIALNSLLHLHERADLEALLAGVRARLRPGGVFALSIMNPDPRTLGRPRRHRLPLLDAPVHDPEADLPLMVEETLNYDHVTQTTRGQLHFSHLEVDGRPGAPDFLVAPADLRVLYPRELEALLHYNGLDVLARFGDFARREFTRASLLQNVVCHPTSS